MYSYSQILLYPDTYRYGNECIKTKHWSFVTPFLKLGEGPPLPPWSTHEATSAFATGVIIWVLIFLILTASCIDVICCKINDTGFTHYICSKTLRKQSKSRRSSQQRVPPIVCAERTVPPGIKQKQSIIGGKDIDHLIHKNCDEFIAIRDKARHAAEVWSNHVWSYLTKSASTMDFM